MNEVAGFAFQIPWWVVVPIVLVIVIGAWKVVKLLLLAVKG